MLRLGRGQLTSSLPILVPERSLRIAHDDRVVGRSSRSSFASTTGYWAALSDVGVPAPKRSTAMCNVHGVARRAGCALLMHTAALVFAGLRCCSACPPVTRGGSSHSGAGASLAFHYGACVWSGHPAAGWCKRRRRRRRQLVARRGRQSCHPPRAPVE